jgi:hypothetical protein
MDQTTRDLLGAVLLAALFFGALFVLGVLVRA